jgi:hypothetical protein
MIIHFLGFYKSNFYKCKEAVIMEFTIFYLLHNMIKIRNNSFEPSHYSKQNLISYFHIVI